MANGSRIGGQTLSHLVSILPSIMWKFRTFRVSFCGWSGVVVVVEETAESGCGQFAVSVCLLCSELCVVNEGCVSVMM